MSATSNVSKLEITKVLVIDDDVVARNLIANHLQRMGIPQVVLKEDGESGLQALAEERFDLIVLDWKLPKLSGLAFFNRIRRRPEYRMTPILVVSGFLEKNDFRLLQEFPATGLMEKPFTVVLFQNRVEELAKESVWYGQNVALVDSVLSAVKEDGKKAEQLLKQVLKSAPNPVPLAVLAARRLIKHGMLKPAQSILEGILKVDDQCVIAMNELGKVLHIQGDHKHALDALRLANKLSPQNLERLCLLGEVGLNLRDPEGARAYFEKALAIDPEDAKAQSGVVIADNMEEMQDADPMRVPRSFASLLNTIGITLVRNGQFAKGIDQYRNAFAFLHSRDDAARIAFNLGLGYLRWGRPNEALPWFQKSESIAPSGFGKSAAYVRQLLTNGGGAEIDENRAAEAAKIAPLGKTPAAPTGPSVTDVEETLNNDEGGAQVIPFPVPSTDEETFTPIEEAEDLGNDPATQVLLKDEHGEGPSIRDDAEEAAQKVELGSFAKVLL